MIGEIKDYFYDFFINKKINACSNVFYSLYFDWQNNIRVCPKKDNGILIKDFNGIWLDTDKIEQDKKSYINKFKISRPDDICITCEYYRKGVFKEQKALKEIHLGHWKNCYLKCRYCSSIKNENLIEAKHYNILSAIDRLIDEKMLTDETKIIFECGDAPLHPEFNRLLYFFIHYESKDIIINTPAVTYRESIADAIGHNKIKLIVNLDCANKQIYSYIKGEKLFETAVANIKRYLQFQEPDEKRIIIKYTLFEGGNDGKKEFSDWFVLIRDLGINEILIDIDENWYERLKNNIPDYLREIAVFIKKISSLDGIKLVFSKRMEKIYNNDR